MNVLKTENKDKRVCMVLYPLHSCAAINHWTALKCVFLMGRKSIIFQEAQKQMSRWGHAVYYFISYKGWDISEREWGDLKTIQNPGLLYIVNSSTKGSSQVVQPKAHYARDSTLMILVSCKYWLVASCKQLT